MPIPHNIHPTDIAQEPGTPHKDNPADPGCGGSGSAGPPASPPGGRA